MPAAGWQAGLGTVHGASFDVNVVMNGLVGWENWDASFKVAVGAPAGKECMSNCPRDN